ncbi:MAG: hypothetical protein K1X79_08795 [Oligoflexia bacterium]|nr:hypothetical protein [Oligoflexia bacterium]
MSIPAASQSLPKPKRAISSADPSVPPIPTPSQLVSWKVIAPIFANVVASPWNLLVGGLLAQELSFTDACISLVIGYLLLACITYIYGGLGLRVRRATSELLEPVFGRRGNQIFFSAILAVGQIGWFAVIVRLGGGSLEAILPALGSTGSTLLYSVLMLWFASLSLFRFALVKSLMTLSVCGLTGFLLYAQFRNGLRLHLNQTSSQSLLWGVSVVVASLISFVTVIPDFTHRLATRADLSRATVFGLCLPGFLFGLFGVLLFQDQQQLLIAPLFATLGMFTLPHVFNLLANTDAAIALYTPAFRLSYMLDCSFTKGLMLAFVMGVCLALVDITKDLQAWIATLGSLYPAIIGVAVARHVLTLSGLRDRAERFQTNWKGITAVVFSSALVLVLHLSLLTWATGMAAFLIYVIMTGVTIQITIGPRSLRGKSSPPARPLV